MKRQLRSHVIITAILILGTLARLAPLGLQRFHEDEALYSSWGLRIASGEDRWLAETPIDKPPVFFYLQAVAFTLFGPSETAARFVSLLASVASIGFLYILTQRLYPQPTSLVAAALLSASPFAISFAPTAFLDAVMGMWILAACATVAHGRWGWGGILLGLAGATKWEGIAFLPLVLGVGLCQDPEHLFHSVSRKCLRGATGLLLVASFVGGWDLIRPQPSIFHQLRVNYGGLALAQPDMWLGRIPGWLTLLRYIFYHPYLNAVFLIGVPILLVIDFSLLRRPESKNSPHTAVPSLRGSMPLQSLRIDVLLFLFLMLYLTAVVVLRIPIWDRYLLGIVPFGCLLLARVMQIPKTITSMRRKAHSRRGESDLTQLRHSGWMSLLVTAFLLFTLPLPLRDAAAGRFPIAGDHGSYQGLKQVVAYFRGHVLGGAILYHRWLGNHYRFYMYRFPYAFRWWQTPQELVRDAEEAADVPRWIVFPSWQDEGPVRDALGAEGLRLVPRHYTYRDDGSLSFTIFQIEGP